MQDPKQKLNQKKRKLKQKLKQKLDVMITIVQTMVCYLLVLYNITHYLQDSSLDTDTAATPHRSSKQAWQKERWKKVDAHV